MHTHARGLKEEWGGGWVNFSFGAYSYSYVHERARMGGAGGGDEWCHLPCCLQIWDLRQAPLSL